MNTVKELLQEADPVRSEPGLSDGERARIRAAVARASAEVTKASAVWFRAPLAVLLTIAAIVIGIVAVGSRSGPRGSTSVYAAVRFEVRLAEDRAAPGLRAAAVTGTDRTVYLHEEIVVTNADIEQSRVVPGSSPSQFNIGVQFNAAGAAKMRRATASHAGRPVAVLIDGEVVMAPVLRDPIDAAALITGDFSQAEAQRIVNGIAVR